MEELCGWRARKEGDLFRGKEKGAMKAP